jgi:hypothetical protein
MANSDEEMDSIAGSVDPIYLRYKCLGRLSTRTNIGGMCNYRKINYYKNAMFVPTKTASISSFCVTKKMTRLRIGSASR